MRNDSITTFGVSEIQRRFLAAEARHAQLAPHLQRSVCLLPAGVDLGRLRQVFAQVSQLQDAFRTSFERGPDLFTFFQHVQPEGGLQLDEQAFDGSADELVQALNHGPLFDQLHPGIDPFGPPPLARGSLLQTQDGVTALALSVHHAIFDGWSAAVLFGQLIELFEAEDAAACLPGIRARFDPYPAFVEHERQTLQGERLATLQGFWRDYLANPPGVAADHAAAAALSLGQEGEVRHTEIALPAEVVQRLDALAGAHRLTTHVLLLACMQWAMAAGNGELDVLTSTPTRNRPARFAETIGCFVNPVIVRQRMDPQRSLLDNLTALRGAATAAYRHGAFPAARVVRELFPELLRQRIPLASSWFAIQVGTATQEVQQRHQFRLLNLAAGRAMGAGFALELRPVDGVLRGPFLTRRHFDPDHLAPRRFLDLVQALLSDPRQTLAQAWRRPLSN
ncbi:condensation domain-containing protein [Ideonella azotifigens]|uniref:Condensation domain-containing protein n=2 Tax=Ideonella azotifigens TaxID=513160 RepID=A0ABN1JNE4_9BURK|nr:condensation domain-containing protein [Ideonella azotifigens]MCD2339938.1 condensation domain-containing protein [Ideonella azotifigens]